jgi:hypothetical protein
MPVGRLDRHAGAETPALGPSRRSLLLATRRSERDRRRRVGIAAAARGEFYASAVSIRKPGFLWL